MNLVDRIGKEYCKPKLPRFNVGDVVEVHVRIPEADKERVQVFGGTVIARKGSGVRETFTVRRIVQGEGVERVFPIHSPFVTAVKVVRRGRVHRAKLYYLRERVGKSTKVREDLGGLAEGPETTAPGPSTSSPREPVVAAAAKATGR